METLFGIDPEIEGEKAADQRGSRLMIERSRFERIHDHEGGGAYIWDPNVATSD